MRLDEGLLRGSDILIVDDDPAGVSLVESILRRNGFSRLSVVPSPSDLPAVMESNPSDLVMLDLGFPDPRAMDCLRILSDRRAEDDYLPVLVLSADNSQRARVEALGAGATDFLSKPLDATEVGLRVLNYLETRRLHLKLEQHTEQLDALVAARTAELEQAHLDMITRLNLVSELRDDETREHTSRVGISAALLARAAGVDEAGAHLYEQAAPLHDLGKVGIPDSVLLKPGRLTPDEFEVIRRHPTIGAQIIGETTSEVLSLARTIAAAHHERWNGEGYPSGLRGTSIPLPGRVVTVCDVFDALTHARPHRAAWSTEQALDELVAQRSRFFDPDLVELFVTKVVPAMPWLVETDQPPRHDRVTS